MRLPPVCDLREEPHFRDRPTCRARHRYRRALPQADPLAARVLLARLSCWNISQCRTRLRTRAEPAAVSQHDCRASQLRRRVSAGSRREKISALANIRSLSNTSVESRVELLRIALMSLRERDKYLCGPCRAGPQEGR